MGLMWVTGVSGVGKSTVHHELLRRGFRSFDADEDGISRWYDRSTGDPVPNPRVRSESGMERYRWSIVESRVEQLATDARQQRVFLCGAIENEANVWELFEKVLCLVVRDDPTLRRRLTDRTTNDFGKAPKELAAILGWSQTIEDRYRSYGATIIDASKSLDQVVDEVVAATGS